MTSKLTIEQAKRLRNDFECWQQDYDPKDDKEQYDMFGRGMAAMDMLIAGMYQEPVAFIDKQWTLVYYVPPMNMGLQIGDKLYRHAQPAPECQHQWRHGGANELQNQKQCIKCGRVDLDAQQPAPVVPEDVRQALSQMDDEIIAELDAEESACRAAQPQAVTLTNEGNIQAEPQNAPQNIPEIIPGWIPVSERMPEDRISVILWDAEIGEVTSGHYSHKTQTFYHCGDAIENEITHWMPPPCAPQEVNRE